MSYTGLKLHIAHINKIKHFVEKKQNVIICGLSIKTKKLISTKKLNIDFILDNNSALTNHYFLNKPIININTLKKIDKKCIIILDNAHMLSFLKQMQDCKCDVFIEYKDFLPLAKLGNALEIILETIDYDSNFEKKSLEFTMASSVLENIKFFNLPIKLLPTKHLDEWYFRPRSPKKNQFLFSYHTVGKSKLNILRYKEGYFNDTIFFDKEGYSGFASRIYKKKVKKISLKKADEDFKYYVNKYIKNNLSKYIQPEQKNIKLPKNYVFFAMQVANDSVARLGYFKWQELLEKLINIFDKNEISLVIKRHPRCYDKNIKNLLDSLKEHKNIHVIDASIHTLIKNAQAVYTVNSGVGFEALLHLKPVVLFGRSDYESACFTCKDLDKLELVPKLTTKKVEYIKQFISYFMSERNFLIDDEEKIKQVVNKALAKFFTHHLQKEFKCKVKIYT